MFAPIGLDVIGVGYPLYSFVPASEAVKVILSLSAAGAELSIH